MAAIRTGFRSRFLPLSARKSDPGVTAGPSAGRSSSCVWGTDTTHHKPVRDGYVMNCSLKQHLVENQLHAIRLGEIVRTPCVGKQSCAQSGPGATRTDCSSMRLSSRSL